MPKTQCKCVLSSNVEDFELKIAELIDDGYEIETARYECYISNFVWYAILIKR